MDTGTKIRITGTDLSYARTSLSHFFIYNEVDQCLGMIRYYGPGQDGERPYEVALGSGKYQEFGTLIEAAKALVQS